MKNKRIETVLFIVGLIIAIAVGIAVILSTPDADDISYDTQSSQQTDSTISTTEESSETSDSTDSTESTDSEYPVCYTYTADDLKNLKNTDIFLSSAIEHIFEGTINKSGEATGYHYDGIEGSKGQIVEGTKTEADENGVYTAKVTVDGIGKSGNGGYSTFFPEKYSPQEVVDMINEAYDNRQLVRGNTYAGVSNGIEIDMYLTDDGKIISAFPVQ